MSREADRLLQEPSKTLAEPVTLPPERILHAIHVIRGHKVILDADLADLYDVQTKVLNQAVKRNIERFPKDFMFQLSKNQFEILKSQSVTSSWGGRRTPPYAFTEQGIAMLSSVLRSSRAVGVNIEIMRTFVQLRRMLATHEELARKLAKLEQNYDDQFKVVFDAIRQLMTSQKSRKHVIGFEAEREVSQ